MHLDMFPICLSTTTTVDEPFNHNDSCFTLWVVIKPTSDKHYDSLDSDKPSYLCVFVCVGVGLCICVSVSGCVCDLWERERERESVYVCLP